MRNTQKRDGFAILIVLIAVAIMMMLYMVDMKAIFRIGPQRINMEKPLWSEEDRIVGPEVVIAMPKPPMPTLADPVAFIGTVTRNESYRGDVAIELNPAGEVVGSWDGSYTHDHKEYTFAAEFAGNIDVSKTYSTDDKSDRSRLYFITKGRYKQTVFNKKAESFSTTDGIIYVAGWLRSDYSAEGKIVITNKDKSWSAEYLWQSLSD